MFLIVHKATLNMFYVLNVRHDGVICQPLQRLEQHDISGRLDIKHCNRQLLLDKFPVCFVQVQHRIQSINQAWETTARVRVMGTGGEHHVTKKKR